MVITNTSKVLYHFTEHKDQEFTIRSLSLKLKINYRIAYEEIQKLHAEGVITIKKSGNASVCRFAYRASPRTIEVETLRKQQRLRNEDLNLIYNRISSIKDPLYILLLFGSTADNTSKKGSDIDLCLITSDEKISKEIKDILKITPVDTHLQEFTPREFLSMITRTDSNVGNEIVKNNVVLHGVESFYELVKDAV